MKKIKKKVVYCTKTPNYPFKAYLIFFYIIDGSPMGLYYPIGSIYSDISNINSEALAFEKDIASYNQVSLGDISVIIPITLDKLYPLQKSFWEKPSIHYSHLNRIDLFGKVLDHPKFYKLVVTPLTYKNKTLFISAIPIYKITSNKNIEKFMTLSDFPVDETAKHAAIYTLGKPFSMNLKTGKIHDIKFKKERKRASLALKN